MQDHSRELIPSVMLQWRCVQRQSLCYKRFCLCMCVSVFVCVWCVFMSSLRLKVPAKPNYMKSNSVDKERERIVKAGQKRWGEMEVGKEWASLKGMRTTASWQAISMNQGAQNSPESHAHLGTDSENCEAGCHITCLLRTWLRHICRHLLASGLDWYLNSEMECDQGRSMWEKRPMFPKRMCRGERKNYPCLRWKSKLLVEEDEKTSKW